MAPKQRKRHTLRPARHQLRCASGYHSAREEKKKVPAVLKLEKKREIRAFTPTRSISWSCALPLHVCLARRSRFAAPKTRRKLSTRGEHRAAAAAALLRGGEEFSAGRASVTAARRRCAARPRRGSACDRWPQFGEKQKNTRKPECQAATVIKGVV